MRIVNLSWTMKLLKKFPKAIRSHGKRAEGGARARGGGRAAEALARLRAWQSDAGGGEQRRRRRSRGASGEARPCGHRTGTDAQRAGTSLGGAPGTDAGGRRPPPRRPPRPAPPRAPAVARSVQRPLFISVCPLRAERLAWAFSVYMK